MKELNLGNKVTNNTPIIKAHSGSIRVENTSNSNLKIEKVVRDHSYIIDCDKQSAVLNIPTFKTKRRNNIIKCKHLDKR